MRAFRFYVRFFSPDPNYMSEECRCCLEPIRPVVTRLHRELCEFFPWHPATEAQRLWLREQSWHHSHLLDFRHDSYPKHLLRRSIVLQWLVPLTATWPPSTVIYPGLGLCPFLSEPLHHNVLFKGIQKVFCDLL